MYPKKSMTQVTVRNSSPHTSKRRIQVRRSSVHGRGVFAVAPIARDERIIEYTGEVIDWPRPCVAIPTIQTTPTIPSTSAWKAVW